MRHTFTYLLACIIFFSLASCDKQPDLVQEKVLTVEDEKLIGKAVYESLQKGTSVYDRTNYAMAYSYLENRLNPIITSGVLSQSSDYIWKVVILEDDAKETFFATPGGYIYLYTGLLKFMENDAQLKFILAEAVALVDKRIAIQRLTERSSVPELIDVALGNNNDLVVRIPDLLLQGAYSPEELEVMDDFAFAYICSSSISINGFDSLTSQIASASDNVELTNTYPISLFRINHWHNTLSSSYCEGTEEHESAYSDFKDLLN